MGILSQEGDVHAGLETLSVSAKDGRTRPGRQDALDLETQDEAMGKVLPFWPEGRHGVPNAILRSALFSVVERGKRKYMKRAEVASIQGLEIRYTGEQLDQSDLDAWQGLLSLARRQQLGDRVEFSIKPFLGMISRSDGKSDREWLKIAISRMSATTIEIRHGDLTYGGSLIDEFYRDERTGRYVIVLNEKLVNLFQPTAWTALDWNSRVNLKRQQLAQWLHAFYSTHSKPFAYKVETLRELSGSGVQVPRMFRFKLRKALDQVAAVTGWGWRITEDGLVEIQKSPGQEK